MLGTTILAVGVNGQQLYIPLRMVVAYTGNRCIKYLKANWTTEENQIKAHHSIILFCLYVGMFVLLRLIKTLLTLM